MSERDKQPWVKPTLVVLADARDAELTLKKSGDGLGKGSSVTS